MNNYVTGSTIKNLRISKGLTQTQLAQQLCVSDKAVSRWETGKGLPDISLLEPLSKALGISVIQLFSGDLIKNNNLSANLKKASFYVCPVCKNVIFSVGESLVSCCGITLPPLEAENMDNDHILTVENVENELFVTVNHEMTKEHYISFVAYVTTDRTEIQKYYPESNAQTRFFSRGDGEIYYYCNHHGLFKYKLFKNHKKSQTK